MCVVCVQCVSTWLIYVCCVCAVCKYVHGSCMHCVFGMYCTLFLFTSSIFLALPWGLYHVQLTVPVCPRLSIVQLGQFSRSLSAAILTWFRVVLSATILTWFRVVRPYLTSLLRRKMNILCHQPDGALPGIVVMIMTLHHLLLMYILL